MKPDVVVIGGGLAGAEAAWQAATKNSKVILYEMRPKVMTPAHHTDQLAELVCSNSLKAKALDNAAGLLKEEMRRLGSLIVKCADETEVPAGGALAVDRRGFAACVTEALSQHDNIEIVREEVKTIPFSNIPVVIATGPLTSDALADDIKEITGEEALYFFDAAAPIVTSESIQSDKVFRASRYDTGGDDYLNCPMDKETYEKFWSALVEAKVHPLKDFEEGQYFEGCVPVEELAKRGKNTLLFGPLKPVGLIDPKTKEQPHAVVQLRQDDKEGNLYNLVGFQTRLTWPEQKRVFRMISGLEEAEFVRYGVMHRNSFIESRKCLDASLAVKQAPHLFFAGQITGVEGYMESASNGLIAGINAARASQGLKAVVFPKETAHGALCHYITSTVTKKFQPMNINYGLLPNLDEKVKDKKKRRRMVSQKALHALEEFCEHL